MSCDMTGVPSVTKVTTVMLAITNQVDVIGEQDVIVAWSIYSRSSDEPTGTLRWRVSRANNEYVKGSLAQYRVS